MKYTRDSFSCDNIVYNGSDVLLSSSGIATLFPGVSIIEGRIPEEEGRGNDKWRERSVEESEYLYQ